eukprot:1469158-Rhodomonas_salina.3
MSTLGTAQSRSMTIPSSVNVVRRKVPLGPTNSGEPTFMRSKRNVEPRSRANCPLDEVMVSLIEAFMSMEAFTVSIMTTMLARSGEAGEFMAGETGRAEFMRGLSCCGHSLGVTCSPETLAPGVKTAKVLGMSIWSAPLAGNLLTTFILTVSPL